MFNYPPFKQMATLEYRHKSEEKARDFMVKLQKKLEEYNIQKNYEIIITHNSFKKYMTCIIYLTPEVNEKNKFSTAQI